MAGIKVLIPLDGSESAENSLSFVNAMRPLGNVRVRLLSVIDTEGLQTEEARQKKEKLSADYLEGLAQPMNGIDFEWVQRTGLPYQEILAEASDSEANFILMATHGWTSFEPERLGSVADKVIRGASIPLVLLSPHSAMPTQIERVMVPLDGSSLSEEALVVARSFTSRLGSILRLVQAVSLPPATESDIDLNLASELASAMRLDAEQYLTKACLDLEPQGRVETSVLSGLPAQAVLKDMRGWRPDLVIMMTHGHTGFLSWALGSVTDRLIRGPAPVLVIQPGQGDRLARAVGG